MNTRHSELKSNELAHWLDDHLSQIKPYVPAILVGGGLLVVLLLAWTFYAGQKNARMAAAWGGVISGLGNESELEQVVEKYPGTSAAAWASYAQGIGDLMQGSNLLFTDREDSEKRLNQAAKKFQSAIDGAGSDQLLISRASFGLAQAYEAQFNLDEAKQKYKEVLTAAPEGPLAEMAQRQLTLLDEESVKDFYGWFAKQTPEPPAPPPGQTPSTQPLTPLSDDLRNLPDLPDLPGSTSPTTPGDGAADSTTPFQPVRPDAPPPQANDVYSKGQSDKGEAAPPPVGDQPAPPPDTPPAPADGSVPGKASAPAPSADGGGN